MRYNRLRKRIYDATTVDSSNPDGNNTEVDQNKERIGDKNEETMDEPSTKGMEEADFNPDADYNDEKGNEEMSK